MGHFSGYFEGASGQFRGQKSLSPLEISLEMAHYVVCPQKKIISRIFKISGALIDILNVKHIWPCPPIPIASSPKNPFFRIFHCSLHNLK
jgi:hypothetical protein